MTYPLATPQEARAIEAIRTGDTNARINQLFDMIPAETSAGRLRGHLVAFADGIERLEKDIEQERCTSTVVIRDRLASMVAGFKESLRFDGVTMAESRTGRVLGWDKPSFLDTCPDCGRENAIGRDSGTCQFCEFEG